LWRFVDSAVTPGSTSSFAAAPATLCAPHYSYAALRNAADFLSRHAFPPRRDALPIGISNIGGTIMIEALAPWAPRILSVLRIYTGLLLLVHGTSKIFGFPAVPIFANIHIGSLFGVAGLFELVGGLLLTVGLFTRPVAFILSGMAAVGYFVVHTPKAFYPVLNGGEFVSLVCFVCLYFALAGAGPWSVDAMMERK
jgi:putative oxidoreductase